MSRKGGRRARYGRQGYRIAMYFRGRPFVFRFFRGVSLDVALRLCEVACWSAGSSPWDAL